MSTKHYHDTVVLVTGAASGIGRAVAFELASRQASLALVDIDQEGLERLRADLGRRPEVWTIQADLRDPAARETVVREAIERFGRIDVLFNNAGVGILSLVEHTRTDDWQWVFDLNVWAPIHMIQLCLPHMIDRRSGHIVNVASVAGLIGLSGLTPYSVTKFAMVGLSEGLRGEVCDVGVDVSVVCPGHIRTSIVDSARNTLGGEARTFLPDWYKGWPVERAARTIVRGMVKRQPRILVGPEAAFLDWSRRLVPGSSFWLSRWFARRCRVMQQPVQHYVPQTAGLDMSPERMMERNASTVR